MSRRKTILLNLDSVGLLIKTKCRSNAVFCEKMGRASYWVTDWYRKDEFGNSKPKNLPSPEEAAKMCEILSVEPEDILVRPEDIALVRSLVDEKKPAAPEGDELDRELAKRISALSQEERDNVASYIEFLLSKRK